MDASTRQKGPGLSREETHRMAGHSNEGPGPPTGPERQSSPVRVTQTPGIWWVAREVTTSVSDGA